jgi:lipopolysaccharide transport system ATP-binding protein
MSSDVTVEVADLSKCYEIYRRPQDRLKQVLWGARRKLYSEFWALRDVSFQVRRGQTVGIIGRNGAGKSTLLQVLCGILTPTTGHCKVDGRVAALLELGAGFNPEFTGRENVYMKATIMGLKRREIDRRFDEIAAFADIGEFIERPTKTYSTGMYLRLAFAVATSVEPEILVVDEALAVGDAAFRRKCYSRMQSIQQNGGTILLVSHADNTVVQLCDWVMLLDRGEVLLTGAPTAVTAKYNKLLFAPPDKVEDVRNELRGLASAPATPAAPETSEPAEHYDPELISQTTTSFVSRGAHIQQARITTLDGRPVNVLTQRKEYLYKYRVTFTQPARRVRFGMAVKTVQGYRLGGCVSHGRHDSIPRVEGGQCIDVTFRFTCLAQRRWYFLDASVLGVVEGTEVFLDRKLDAVMFKVLPEPDSLLTGAVDFAVEPEVRFVTAAAPPADTRCLDLTAGAIRDIAAPVVTAATSHAEKDRHEED